MKFNSRILRILSCSAYALAIAITAFQAMAYALAYEAPKTNYFSANSPFPTIATILALLGALGGIALYFLLPKQGFSENKIHLPIASLFSALGFAAGAVVLFLSGEGLLAEIATICLALAALYEIAVVLTAGLDSTVHAWVSLIGFSAVIGSILLVAYYYFDTTLEMNAPLKVTAMMGLLSVILYLTAELRCLLEKDSPKLHRALSLVLLSIGSLSGIPVLIFFVSEKQPLHAEYLAGAFVVFGVWVANAIRFWSLMQLENTDEAAKEESQALTESHEQEPIAAPSDAESAASESILPQSNTDIDNLTQNLTEKTEKEEA